MKKIWQVEQSKGATKTDPVMQPGATTKPKAAGRKDTTTSSPEKREETTAPRDATRIAPKSVVGASMSIVGDLEAKEDLLVAGSLEGTISLDDCCLTVARSGVLKASVKSRSLVVEGSVNGDIDCSDSVELKATARVTGNIRLRRFNVVDGAVFNGKITMLAPEK